VRATEGTAVSIDLNAGVVSTAVIVDDKGFVGVAASYGPGKGLSVTVQETKVATFTQIGAAAKQWIADTAASMQAAADYILGGGEPESIPDLADNPMAPGGPIP